MKHIRNIILFINTFLFAFTLSAGTNRFILTNFSVNGHGIFVYKTPDLIEGEHNQNHAFSYGRIRFNYNIVPELRVSYELYLEETSYCDSYYSKDTVLGHFQGVYENKLFNKIYLKAMVGNLERITLGAGLTYKEYEGQGSYFKAEYKGFHFSQWIIGIGYISSSDVLCSSFGWKDYLTINIINIPTHINNTNELFLTVHSKIDIFKNITLYGEIGKELLSKGLIYRKNFANYASEKFRSGGLIGLTGEMKNNNIRSILNIEARGYEKKFNRFHLLHTDNDYIQLEVRDKSINNWRNYYSRWGKVCGFFLKSFNDIRIINDFYFNLEDEYLYLKYRNKYCHFNIYQVGIKYLFTEYTEAFAGIANRNLQVPIKFTHELHANPYLYTYLKIKF